jgi:hypothetical protein
MLMTSGNLANEFFKSYAMAMKYSNLTDEQEGFSSQIKIFNSFNFL